MVSLVVTIAMLVVWVIYVVHSVNRIRELAGELGVVREDVHWILLAVGCTLFFVMICGLTYQLAQSYAQLRYARKQEEFVSNISHEMKSPVAAIRLHAETLRDSPRLSPELRERSLDFILAESQRLGRLVDDVLESSRLVARKQRLRLEPLPLADFFSTWEPQARRRVEAQGLTWSCRGPTDQVVMASHDGLERVLDNLVENAIRFSERGGEIRCRVREAEERVVLEVEDDGIGIPRSELHKIFDRFYQIRRGLSDRPKGSGLGLSIVSGLVREMGGKVEAQSQEGAPGSRFIVSLPVVMA